MARDLLLALLAEPARVDGVALLLDEPLVRAAAAAVLLDASQRLARTRQVVRVRSGGEPRA